MGIKSLIKRSNSDKNRSDNSNDIDHYKYQTLAFASKIMSYNISIIGQISEIYSKYGSDLCNKILSDIFNQYEAKALSSGERFFRVLSESPLYLKIEIEWYNNSRPMAPLQIFSLIYNEDTKEIVCASTSNYLTGPPDDYDILIKEIPGDILLNILKTLKENLKDN